MRTLTEVCREMTAIRALADDLLSGTAAAIPADARPPGPPEVTVAMPARNAGLWVAEAVASVLRQRGVTLELLVVDDASTDRTAEIVARIPDPRLRLLRNETHRGIGYTHNRIVAESAAPFVAHVDADDVIFQGALRALLDALAAAPGAAQAYCNHFELDARGDLSPRAFEEQWRFLERERRLHPDYRRALIEQGMVTNTLRTYRRSALASVGPFDEALPFAIDYDMAVRLADRFDMVLVPRFLYGQRVHGANTQETQRMRAIRSWHRRARICRRRARERGGVLLGYEPREIRHLLARSLLDAVGLRRAARAARAIVPGAPTTRKGS